MDVGVCSVYALLSFLRVEAPVPAWASTVGGGGRGRGSAAVAGVASGCPVDAAAVRLSKRSSESARRPHIGSPAALGRLSDADHAASTRGHCVLGGREAVNVNTGGREGRPGGWGLLESTVRHIKPTTDICQ